MMRAKGYPAKNIFKPVPTGAHVALHARWLHGDPDSEGMITYKTGEVQGEDSEGIITYKTGEVQGEVIARESLLMRRGRCKVRREVDGVMG
jgi:hypothetical protein